MTHPDWRCPGCNRPIEPLAAIRTYHAGCDPYVRIEKLENTLRDVIANYNTAIEFIDNPAEAEAVLLSATLVVHSGRNVLEAARAALKTEGRA